MRKLLFILLSMTMALSVIGIAFSESRTVSDSPVLVDWAFTPEVSTDLGFNLDKGSYGLTGVANIDIESTIIGKANQEFTGSGLAYGSITAKDIELKLIVEDKVDGYDSTGPVDQVVKLTIGEIIGMVHIGPAYIKLHALSHDEVNEVSSTKAAFSVINYDIINPHFTGGYQGREAISTTGNQQTGAVGAVATEGINYSFGDSGAFLVGFDLPNLLKVELGFSTQFGYNDVGMYDYNPYAASLFLEIKAVENLSIKLKTALQSGMATAVPSDASRTQVKGIMDEGNPLSLYASVGYTVPLGNGLSVVPILGADLQFENQQSFANDIIMIAESQGQGALDNPSIFTTAYEIGLGVRLLWTDKGVKEDESDYLSMSPDDVEVSDGVSLGFVYGQVPYVDIRQLSSPYVGVKIAMWESEDSGKPGIVPGLKLGLIVDVNYAIGGAIDIKDDLKTQSGTALYDKYEFDYGSRMDLGWGIEASYTYNAIKPYFGILHKWFDITEAENKATQTATGGLLADQETVTNFNDNTRFVVAGDLRAKLGLEVTKVVPFTTFTLEWQSGDLLIDEVADTSIAFGDTAFFKNNKTYDASYDDSAKLGYIKLGAKVSF